MRRFICLSLVVLELVVASVSRAQVAGTGRIYGFVHDSSGAVVPGAQVFAQSLDTGSERSTVSTGSGDFVLADLPVGRYRVSVTKRGFKTFSLQGILLHVDQAVRIDAALEVGSVNETVVVTGTAPLLQTMNGILQTVVDERRMVDLPLNGRNVLQLTLLVPGVAPNSGAGINQAYTFPNQQFVSASGGRGNTVDYILDGVNNNDPYTNVANMFPDPDAIEEFTFETNNFSAEFGGRTGAVVNAVTRSGSNSLHGSLFEFVRNTDMNATNFFTPGVGDGLKRNQYGGTVGGPIKKDKAFFFFSYQGTGIRQYPFSSATTLTEPQANGDFSDFRNGSGHLITLKNPATDLPFSNNQIPTSLFSPVASKLLQQIPISPNPSGLVYFRTRNNSNDEQIMGRGDYTPTKSDRLLVHYLYDQFTYQNPLVPGNIISGSFLPNFQTDNVEVSDTHTFSPTMLGVFSIAFNRVGTIHQPPYPFDFQSLGVQITKIETGNDLGVAVPAFFTIPNLQYAQHASNDFEYQAAFTNEIGRHELKYGFDIIRHQFNNPFTGFETAGYFTFANSFSGSNLTDFLLGVPSNFTQITPWAEALRGTEPALYVQDNFKATRKLTLNLGLRWEPLLPWIDVRNNEIALFAPGQHSQRAPGLPTDELVAGDPGVPQGGYPSAYDKFDPRIGFAYLLRQNTTVRGGFGVFHDYADIINNNVMATSPPFSVEADVQNPTSFTDPFTATTPNPFPVSLPPPKSYVFPTPVTFTTYSPTFTNSYTMEWNFTVGHQFSNNWLFSVSYMGSHANHLEIARDANAAIYIPGSSSLSNVNERRPYQPFATIMEADDAGVSSYDALAATLEKRFNHGYTLLAGYTFSRVMDIASSTVAPNSTQITDPYNPFYDYAPADFDVPQRLVISGVWNLPKPSAKNWVAQNVLGGWQANSIITFQSGTPFSVSDGINQQLDGGTGADRPDLVGDPYLSTSRSTSQLLQEYFNITAFKLNAPGSYGTAGRNIILGPGLADWDFSLFKLFTIRERVQAQFRAEFFNFLNRPNFGNPTGALNSPLYGHITGASSPRILQFGLHFAF